MNWFKVTYHYTSQYTPTLALSELVDTEKLNLMQSNRNLSIIGVQEIDDIKKFKQGRIYTDRENGVYYE